MKHHYTKFLLFIAILLSVHISYGQISVSATANPPEICEGSSSQLVASAIPALNYQVDPITFAPIAGSGTFIFMTDDETQGPFPIGFTFNFYGVNYTEFYISSNGFIFFDPLSNFYNGCCTGQILPDAFQPNGLIAGAWEDLYPIGGGTIDYYTTGTAGSQILVVNYTDVPHFAGGDPVTMQILCYEGSGIIEVHTTTMPGNPSGFWAGHTEGIENETGTLAVWVPGRNSDATWTATNDAWRFTPIGYTYDWTPATGLSATNIPNPIATPVSTTVYTVTATDINSGYTASTDVTVTVVATPNAGTISADEDTLCVSGAVTLTLNGYTGNSTIQWQESATSGGPYTDIVGATTSTYATPVLSATTYYVAQVTCTNTSTSAEIEIVVEGGGTMITSTTDATICGQGTGDLMATANGDIINWYDVPTGGIPLQSDLGTSSTFSPFVINTTTYYAGAALGQININNVGAPDTSIGFSTAQVTYNYLNFDVLAPCTLVGFTVYPAAVGTETISLYDANFYNLLQNWTVTFSASDVGNPVFVTLNYPLPLGTNFHMYQNFPSVAMYQNDFGAAYPYTIPGIISITGNGFGGTTYPYFYNWVIDYSEFCESPRVPVTLTVTPAPALDITPNPSNATICGGSGASVTLDATNVNYNSYTWAPGTGLSSTTGPIVDASPAATTTYILNATDGTCNNADTIIVNVVTPPSVTASADPDSMCSGGSSQLASVVVPALNYTVTSIPFAPVSGTGTPVFLSDDQTLGPFPIGFTYNFYGVDYTEFYISSNGFIFFDPLSNFFSGCCTGQILPDVFQPNGVIAGAWEDLYPPDGGTIEYFTTGVAPNQIMVVNYTNINHYPSGSGDAVTMQILCYQTTNCVEIHITAMPGNPSASGFWAGHTEGLESADGTLGVTVPGRNSDATWTAFNDAWRFCPIAYTYDWTPNATLSASNIPNPVSTPATTTTYTVTVTDTNTGCEGSTDVTVTVVAAPNAGTISTSAESVCSSGSVDLTLSGYTEGATIQWQESATSGGPYSNIGGATNNTYTTPVLTSTTYYVAVVTCANSSTTGEIEIEVLIPPPPPVGIDGEHCGDGQVWLGASGTGTLVWYDSPNGNYMGSGSPFQTPLLTATDTFYVQDLIGALPAAPLTTTYLAGNAQNGNMFDINVLNTITISSFDGHLDFYYGVASIEIYFKPGTHVGFENNAAAWGLPIGSAAGINPNGIGVPTPYPINVNLTLTPGVYSFYITRTDFGTIAYTNGSFVGNIYSQDGNLQIMEGKGNAYPFGAYFEPRIWNGTIHYTSAGCGSTFTPVIANIYQPDFTATASDLDICEGNTSVLLAQNNNGFGSWHFLWDPIISSMIPANGASDTVGVIPGATTTFNVTIHNDSTSSCVDSGSVTINVHPQPTANFTGFTEHFICLGASPVTLTGIPAGGVFVGSSGLSGNIFNPGVAGLGTDTITYIYTDQYGCTAAHSYLIIVQNCVGIDEVLLNNAITVFPNPNEGHFTISMAMPQAADNVQMRIFNVLGELMYAENLGGVASEVTKEYDFGTWASGSYYIEFNADGTVTRKQFTIQQ